MFTARTLNEGKWPLLVLLALSIAGVFWCWCAAVLSLALLAFTIWFFRDPDVDVPADENLVVAPASGKVVEIRTAGQEAMVGIFLSVFDVHVQRAPIAGEVKFVQYNAGKFLDARNPRAAAVNENRVVAIESDDGYRVTVRQIAGLIARRVVGWVERGAKLNKGDRLGMIRFGSRVELYLPACADIAVARGQHVKGGETVIARRRPKI
jgi:phosphatidylserine decarboxylase